MRDEYIWYVQKDLLLAQARKVYMHKLKRWRQKHVHIMHADILSSFLLHSRKPSLHQKQKKKHIHTYTPTEITIVRI